MAANEGPCASFAKYGAMRAYKADPSVNSGNGEAKYQVDLVKTRSEKSLYLVTVSEEATRTVASYFVTTEASDATCKILDVSKTQISDF